MFRKRALQELTDIVATSSAESAPASDSPDPKVVTVQRIQDLLQEVGVDPGEDPVEAARSFLESVDNKLPKSFGSFRLGRPKVAHEEIERVSEPLAPPPPPEWTLAPSAPAASEFDAPAFPSAGFPAGPFESTAPAEVPPLPAPPASTPFADTPPAASEDVPVADAAEPFWQVSVAPQPQSLPDWIIPPGGRPTPEPELESSTPTNDADADESALSADEAREELGAYVGESLDAYSTNDVTPGEVTWTDELVAAGVDDSTEDVAESSIDVWLASTEPSTESAIESATESTIQSATESTIESTLGETAPLSDDTDLVEDVVWPPPPEPLADATPVAWETPKPVDSEPVAASTSVDTTELADANARIDELQAAVMERAAQRDAIRDELDTAEGRVRELEAVVTEHERERGDLERERAELAARVAELEHAAQQAEVQISESQRALVEAQHATDRAVLESADITSFEFKGELAPTFEELATAITALEATLAEREHDHAGARGLLAQHEANIAELTAQRNDAYAAIAAGRERERELSETLERLQAESEAAANDALTADARRAELARLQAELDRAEASLRTMQANEAAANEELARRRTDLNENQQQLGAVRDALRIATTECEAAERRLSVARTQIAEAEAARNGARAEAERVIELAMRQAHALRADAERQAEAARILHDAANEAITLQTDAQREADVVRKRAAKEADAIRAEREAAAPPEGEHVAPAILSALITRVASIESHLSQYREPAQTADEELADAAAPGD